MIVIAVCMLTLGSGNSSTLETAKGQKSRVPEIGDAVRFDIEITIDGSVRSSGSISIALVGTAMDGEDSFFWIELDHESVNKEFSEKERATYKVLIPELAFSDDEPFFRSAKRVIVRESLGLRGVEPSWHVYDDPESKGFRQEIESMIALFPLSLENMMTLERRELETPAGMYRCIRKTGSAQGEYDEGLRYARDYVIDECSQVPFGIVQLKLIETVSEASGEQTETSIVMSLRDTCGDATSIIDRFSAVERKIDND